MKLPLPGLVVVAAAALVPASGAGAEAPPFVGTVSTLDRAALPYSYRSGCPVGPSQLRLLRVSHWGFDGRVHTGSIVVRARVARDVLTVFRRLYAQRFPIRRMRPVDAYRGSDPASMAADNTSGFNCRYAVSAGPRRWSAHAYGEAIDVNPVENPYVLGGTVRPRAGSRYLDRTDVRPGMALPDGARAGVPRDRLAVGRPLEGVARLPALLGFRGLTRIAFSTGAPTLARVNGNPVVHARRRGRARRVARGDPNFGLGAEAGADVDIGRFRRD